MGLFMHTGESNGKEVWTLVRGGWSAEPDKGLVVIECSMRETFGKLDLFRHNYYSQYCV